MKILLLSHKFYPAVGGIETVSEMLASAFAAAGHQVHVLTLTDSPGTRTFPYPVIRKPGIGTLFRELKQADIVFENNITLRLSWLNFILRKPHVIALHTWIRTAQGKVRLQDRLKFRCLQLADRIITCSEALRKQTFAGATIIGNPYDDRLFRVQPGIARDRDYVFLGRLVSDKGADLAINAFRSFLQQAGDTGSGSTLTIIGDGPEREALQALVAQHHLQQQVFFTGSLQGEELVSLLNRHRYLLVPSLWEEPFGLVALEGLACGCLPIVSDSGGLPDAIGEAGITFSRGDEAHLVKSMLRLKEDPVYANRIRAAAAAQLKKHESKSIALQYLQVLKDVLHPGTAGSKPSYEKHSN